MNRILSFCTKYAGVLLSGSGLFTGKFDGEQVSQKALSPPSLAIFIYKRIRSEIYTTSTVGDTWE